MLDAYDKVIREHSQQFLKIGDKSIPVVMLSGDEAEDKQLFSISGSGDKSDKISFPIVGIARLPIVEITDQSATKRQMNFSAYSLQSTETAVTTLNGMLCNLKYIAVVFAETRKITEDLGLQYYFRLRNNKQVNATIMLPISRDNKKYTAVRAEPEIILDPNLEQVRVQGQEEAQLYKFKFTFTLQNCYVFDFNDETVYDFEWIVRKKLSGEHKFSE